MRRLHEPVWRLCDICDRDGSVSVVVELPAGEDASFGSIGHLWHSVAAFDVERSIIFNCDGCVTKRLPDPLLAAACEVLAR